MARRITTAVITPHYTPAWVTVLEWNGLTPNDPVKVTGERGDFTFISAHEKDGEVIAVNVYGGLNGHKMCRSFYPSKVSKKAVKRSRNPRPDDL